MMKYSSFLYLSCLLVAIECPSFCHSEGFFGKLIKFATGGNNEKNKNKRNKNKNSSIHNNYKNRDGAGNSPHDFPTTTLWNDVHFPLVGMGVGNMEPEIIPAIVSHGLKKDKNIRLIDTAHISQNEFLVARGIVEGVNRLVLASDDAGASAKITATSTNGSSQNATVVASSNSRSSVSSNSDEIVEVHVITKIWYTHLGYERTLQAAKFSMEGFREALDHPNVDLKIHLMLHWPRCYENIPWMDCEGEEANLPHEVKTAGPPPHLDPGNAWKQSWKAMEELVIDKNNPFASIGVSNFHRKELEDLVSFAKIAPHVVETDTWSLLYDPLLIEFCHKRGIHLVAYHLMEGTIAQSGSAPFATHHLLSLANDVTKQMRSSGILSEDDRDITMAQIVLVWLVQHSISVIPRTTDLYHLQENSAESLASIPAMDDGQVQVVAQSVEALISGEDLTEDAFVTLTFHAKSKDVFLYWHDPEFGGEIEVAKIQKGTSFEESSHPGHQFRIYYDTDDAASGGSGGDGLQPTNGKTELFTVSGNYGEHRHIDL